MHASKCDYYETSAKSIRMLEIFSWSAKIAKHVGFWLRMGLMEYLKYSFDTENESSNPKSIKQYRSPYSLHDLQQHGSSYNLLNQWDPGEKPLQPQHFRKAIATKIIYFLWIRSEHNLSCMLCQHWVLTKIFPMMVTSL